MLTCHVKKSRDISYIFSLGHPSVCCCVACTIEQLICEGPAIIDLVSLKQNSS
jgi:hypothetical protein